ncbi:DNA-binding protein [Desulfuromonas versatilis]|uniref:DNA-binding protein n=1 Tax=Desulfuromonas versatilis TaxID=2802975 RepID=A0ABM8I0D6_9BACT|nr:DNA-binding protein [Desulfuromonas versatilis]
MQDELRRIRGIGEVLAQRLVEAGIDSHAKLAELGEEGLARIRGVQPRMIPAILEQARGLAAEEEQAPEEKTAALRAGLARVREQVQQLVARARERLGGKLKGDREKRLEKQERKLLSGLERFEALCGARPKQAAKRLAKIEKRLDGLEQAGARSLARGLKKARRPLKRTRA